MSNQVSTMMESCEQEETGQGHSLPLARVKTIISTVPDVLPASPDGLFAFTKATEIFIEDLIRGVFNRYGANIDYDEVADYILENDELAYLHDFFPRRMTYENVMKQVRAKEEE